MKNVEYDKEDNIIFNQQSTALVITRQAIDFDYQETDNLQLPISRQNQAIAITISELPSLKTNQIVDTTATVSLGGEPPKTVYIQRTKENVRAKEEVIVEDMTGNAPIHIWEPIFEQIEDGKTYLFKILVVKSYKGKYICCSCPYFILLFQFFRRQSFSAFSAFGKKTRI